jgi:hypothetical protein
MKNRPFSGGQFGDPDGGQFDDPAMVNLNDLLLVKSMIFST